MRPYLRDLYLGCTNLLQAELIIHIFIWGSSYWSLLDSQPKPLHRLCFSPHQEVETVALLESIFGFVLVLGTRGVCVGGVLDVLMLLANIVFWQALTDFLKPEVRPLLPVFSFCFYIAYNLSVNYLYFTLMSG